MHPSRLNEEVSEEIKKDLANNTSDDSVEEEGIVAPLTHLVTKEKIQAINQAWSRLLEEVPKYLFYKEKTPEVTEIETLLKYSKPANINSSFPTHLIKNIENPLKKLQTQPEFYLDIAKQLFNSIDGNLNIAVKAILVANPHHIFSWLIQDAGIEQLVNLFLYKIDCLIISENKDLINQHDLEKTIYKFIKETRGKGYTKKRVEFMRDKLSDILTQDQIDEYEDEGFKVYYVEVSNNDSPSKSWPKDLTELSDSFVITQENAIIVDQETNRVLAVLKTHEIPNQKAAAIGSELNKLRAGFFQDGSLRNRGNDFKSKAGSFSIGYIRSRFIKSNKKSQVDQALPKKNNIRQLLQEINPSLNATFAKYLPQTYQASLEATKKFAEVKLTLGETSPHTSIAVNKTSKSMPCHRDLNQINFGILVCFKMYDKASFNTGTCFLEWKIQGRSVRFNLKNGDMLIADFSYLHCVYDDELGIDTEEAIIKRGSCVFYTHQNLFPSFKILASGSDVEEMPSSYTESAIYTKKKVVISTELEETSEPDEDSEDEEFEAQIAASIGDSDIPLIEVIEAIFNAQLDGSKRKLEEDESEQISIHAVPNKKRKQACTKVLYLTDAVQMSYKDKLRNGIIPSQGDDQWILVLKEKTDTLFNEGLHKNAERMLLTEKDLRNHRRNTTWVAVHPATKKAFDHMPRNGEPVMLVQRAQLVTSTNDYILVKKYNQNDIRTATYDDLNKIESDSTLQFMLNKDFLSQRAKYERTFKKTVMPKQVLAFRDYLLKQSIQPNSQASNSPTALKKLSVFKSQASKSVLTINPHSKIVPEGMTWSNGF